MGLRCVPTSLTEFIFIVLLLEFIQFGQSLADSRGKNGKHFTQSKDALPTERSPGSCCVCGAALYKATFLSKWNKTTHPNDYPENLAQFTTVVGGTHTDAHVVWQLGSKASSGVKKFAEWGDTRSLLNESTRKNYLGIVRIGPIIKTQKPISDTFRADKYHHYLSIISKIKPSPDWFVGVDRFDLCNATDCSWKNNITIQLGPIDAGTDSGIKFMASNIQSTPTEAIHQIKPNVPNHPAASFFNPGQTHVPAMAEFKIELVRTKGRCSRNTKTVSHCVVSRWSSWTPCSVQCGRGIKTRGRVVITPAQNGGRACPKVTRTKGCRGRNCTVKVDCVVSPWGPWTGCSRTCGKGRKSRKRSIVMQPGSGGKKCPRLEDKKRCRIKRCPILHCKVSAWTEWGACSKTCGKGRRHRTRKLLQEPSKGGSKCPALRERQYCNTFDCRGRSKLSSISGK